jgi:hypothetical protein
MLPGALAVYHAFGKRTRSPCREYQQGDAHTPVSSSSICIIHRAASNMPSMLGDYSSGRGHTTLLSSVLRRQCRHRPARSIGLRYLHPWPSLGGPSGVLACGARRRLWARAQASDGGCGREGLRSQRSGSIPDTWVTVHSGDTVPGRSPAGRAAASSRRLRWRPFGRRLGCGGFRSLSNGLR